MESVFSLCSYVTEHVNRAAITGITAESTKFTTLFRSSPPIWRSVTKWFHLRTLDIQMPCLEQDGRLPIWYCLILSRKRLMIYQRFYSNLLCPTCETLHLVFCLHRFKLSAMARRFTSFANTLFSNEFYGNRKWPLNSRGQFVSGQTERHVIVL